MFLGTKGEIPIEKSSRGTLTIILYTISTQVMSIIGNINKMLCTNKTLPYIAGEIPSSCKIFSTPGPGKTSLHDL